MAQKKKRVLIWVLGVFGVLVVLLAGAAIYVSAQWKPILTEKIKEGVDKASNQLYRIDFQDIHLNLLTGSAVLDSIKFTPDTLVFKRLKAAKQAPSHLYRIKLAHLKLSGVGILTAYFKKKIDMSAILIDHPSIDVIYHKVPKRADSIKVEKTLYQQISKSLKSIYVRDIRVVDADIDYYHGAKKLNSVQHFMINVKDFLIDSVSQFDTTRVFNAKDIGFEMIGYQSLTKDKMYTLKVDTLRGSMSNKVMRAKGFKLMPMYKDLAFSRRYREQKDRYDLNFSEIAFTGVDFVRLNDEGELQVERVAIGQAKVAVFMNRALPPPNFDKGRNYPHNALKRVPLALRIDSLTLDKVDIAYTEFNPKTNERGTLRLDNLSGRVLHLTNDSVLLSKNNHAKADLTTYVMGVGRMNVKIDFNLTGKYAPFSYVGEISGFDMKVLNPLSRSLGLIAIESGRVKQASFSIHANELGSSGTVKFLYNNLKVNLLKENDEGGKEKKGFLSFLANTMLIRDNNPTDGEAARVVNVKLERLPQASFFNLMWKSVFIGIRETVGIGIVPIKAMPKTKSTKKELRQQRREERKTERAKGKEEKKKTG